MFVIISFYDSDNKPDVIFEYSPYEAIDKVNKESAKGKMVSVYRVELTITNSIVRLISGKDIRPQESQKEI